MDCTPTFLIVLYKRAPVLSLSVLLIKEGIHDCPYHGAGEIE